MFDYLQQFNKLSPTLKAKISSPEIMARISELENKYQVDLAMLIMKVMIKEISIQDLPDYFKREDSLSPELSEKLSQDLMDKVFVSVADYLSLKQVQRKLDLDKDIGVLVKEANIILASSNLLNRLKNILATYLRGVRNKIDTRHSLTKNVKIGGLGLSIEEADRILYICDSGRFKADSLNQTKNNSSVQNKVLHKELEEYDLKRSLMDRKENKSISHQVNDKEIIEINNGLKLDHEITAPKKQLDLKKVKKPLSIEAKPHQLDLEAPDQELELMAPIKKKLADNITSDQVIKHEPSLNKIKPKEALQEKSKVVRMVAPELKLKPVQKTVTPPKAPPVKTTPSIKPSPKKDKQKVDSSGIFKSLLNRFSFRRVDKTFDKSKGKDKVNKKIVSQIKNNPPSSRNRIIQTENIVKSNKEDAPLVKRKENINNTSIASRRQAVATSSRRVQMHDVRPVPKVMGPIEELKFLDPLNFRRLSKKPSEATAKIFAKIKLLEKDGYDKMIAGVQAWRKSPVNRLYLQLGQEAIKEGVFLKDIVNKHQKNKEEYLSMEEIEAIVTLNSKLIF